VDLTTAARDPRPPHQLTHKVDPFTLLKAPKLTDGTWIDAAELKARLVENPKADLFALEESDLNRDFAERTRDAHDGRGTASGQERGRGPDRTLAMAGFQTIPCSGRRAACWLPPPGWAGMTAVSTTTVAVGRERPRERRSPGISSPTWARLLGYTTRFFHLVYEKPEQMKDAVPRSRGSGA
jgi:hypothetical protein